MIDYRKLFVLFVLAVVVGNIVTRIGTWAAVIFAMAYGTDATIALSILLFMLSTIIVVWRWRKLRG